MVYENSENQNTLNKDILDPIKDCVSKDMATHTKE